MPCLLPASRADAFPRSFVVPACYPFRSFRSIVVSFGSPFVRQVGRGDGGLRLCLGSPRSLLPVACRGGSWMRRGGVSLVGLARCRRVDGVGCLRVFRRPRCLPWVILSDWRVSLVPVACFALVVIVCRHGLIVVGCCRRGSVSSSVVVARRRFVLLALGCRRHPCSPRGASAVDRLVDRV